MNDVESSSACRGAAERVKIAANFPCLSVTAASPPTMFASMMSRPQWKNS